MNTHVSFEIAKLLREKRFNLSVSKRYNSNGKLSRYTQFPENYNTGVWSSECSAPTIADVVMWLYKEYSLWILALPTITGHFAYKIVDVQLNPEKTIERPPYKDVSSEDFNLPTEAYEAAIKYILNTLII